VTRSFAYAQQPVIAAPRVPSELPTTVHRIGFINSGALKANENNVTAFRAGLADHGYVEGENIIIDFRWADSAIERLPSLVSELLSLKPDVIVSTGGPPTIVAVKAATTSVPVVFITGDPVKENIVPSLSRPGSNLTGFAVLSEDLEAKRLALLKETLPSATRVGILWNPTQPTSAAVLNDVQAAAARLNMTLHVSKARDARELEQALSAIPLKEIDALFVVTDAVLGWERERIVDFALQNRLPGIYFWREFAEIGGLMSYATSLPAVYRRAATSVDKILKGAKAGDLPIEQPTTFELIINLKTAKTLGITIPQSVLLRANEVIG